MKICKVEGCEHKHCANGYCRKHYTQIKKHGKLRPDLERQEYVKKEQCEIPTCEEPTYSKNLCHRHYSQKVKNNEIKMCIVIGCHKITMHNCSRCEEHQKEHNKYEAKQHFKRLCSYE